MPLLAVNHATLQIGYEAILRPALCQTETWVHICCRVDLGSYLEPGHSPGYRVFVCERGGGCAGRVEDSGTVGRWEVDERQRTEVRWTRGRALATDNADFADLVSFGLS